MVTVAVAGLGYGLARATPAEPGVLVDQFARPFPQKALRGHYLLVYFGYTHCPDICPATLSTLSAVLRRLGPLGRKLRVVFVTVDPQRDTPDVMRTYLGHFDSAIIGLTGSAAEIADAEAAFGAPVRRAGDGGLTHGAFVYFMDTGGKLINAFHAEDSASNLVEVLRSKLAD